MVPPKHRPLRITGNVAETCRFVQREALFAFAGPPVFYERVMTKLLDHLAGTAPLDERGPSLSQRTHRCQAVFGERGAPVFQARQEAGPQDEIGAWGGSHQRRAQLSGPA